MFPALFHAQDELKLRLFIFRSMENKKPALLNKPISKNPLHTCFSSLFYIIHTDNKNEF